MSASASTWAILPIKSMRSAKVRLGNVLTVPERQSLFRAMLVDVLAAIGQSTRLDGLAIVTRDPIVRRLTRRCGARFLHCDRDAGQSLAVATAAKTLASDGVAQMVTIPGDVPLLTGAEIDTLCATLGPGRPMTVVPNRDGTGTNSIACALPCAIPFSFGEASLRKHLAAAGQMGIPTNLLRLPGLSLDMDVGADLVEFLQRDVSTASRDFLIESGIARRLLVSAPSSSASSSPASKHAGAAQITARL